MKNEKWVMEKVFHFQWHNERKFSFSVRAVFQVKFLNNLRQFFLASTTNNVETIYTTYKTVCSVWYGML